MALEFDTGGRSGQIVLTQTQGGLRLVAHQIDATEAVAELSAQRGDRIEVRAGLQPVQQGRVGFRLSQEGFQLGVGHGDEHEMERGWSGRAGNA